MEKKKLSDLQEKLDATNQERDAFSSEVATLQRQLESSKREFYDIKKLAGETKDALTEARIELDDRVNEHEEAKLRLISELASTRATAVQDKKATAATMSDLRLQVDILTAKVTRLSTGKFTSFGLLAS